MTYPVIRDRRLWLLHVGYEHSMDPLALVDRLCENGFSGFMLTEPNIWRYERRENFNYIRERAKHPDAYRPGLNSMVRSTRNKHRAFGPRRRYDISGTPMGLITIDIDKLSLQLFRSPPFDFKALKVTTQIIEGCLEPGLTYTAYYSGLAESMNDAIK